MSRLSQLALLFALILPFTSCIPLVEKEVSAVDNPDLYPWKAMTAVSANQPIRGIHATPFELYFLSNNFTAKRVTFELRSIIRDCTSITFIGLGKLPLKIRKTLYCGCVSPKDLKC